MLVLVVSDFHLGKGTFLSNGQKNLMEDFDEDDRFIEFVDYYCSEEYKDQSVHLVLNGDILNLIQIDYLGIFTHIMDEQHCEKSLKCIINGHKKFFKSLKRFLSQNNKKISYVIGNHDAGMAFEGCQKIFSETVGAEVQFTQCLEFLGIHIEHGHRFEAINSVAPDQYFISGPNGKKILNLPWGSLFCLSILPKLKKERPYIDKIRPMSSYVIWTIFHDIFFFFRMAYVVISYLITSNRDEFLKQNRNFKTTLKILKQITIYPKYEKKARSILKNNPLLKVVVMGHTHLIEWRKFPEGKIYFNTGTWNSIPTIDAAAHESNLALTYVLVDIHDKTNEIINAKMNVWQGTWKPFREKVNLESI